MREPGAQNDAHAASAAMMPGALADAGSRIRFLANIHPGTFLPGCRMRIPAGKSSARMGRKRPRCSRTRSLNNPTSQSFAHGPLQPGRVSLHKGDTLEKMCARHRTVRRQNRNSRSRPEKYDHNRAVRTGGMIVFLPMATLPASLVAYDNGGGHTKERISSLDDGSRFLRPPCQPRVSGWARWF